MRPGRLAWLALALMPGCGADQREEAQIRDVQVEEVAAGLNYPAALAYVRSAAGDLAAGTVLVGQAGNVGAGRNSVIAIAPNGAPRRIADETTLAIGNRPMVGRPEALDLRGPFIALANFAQGPGSLAFFDPSGLPVDGVLRNGLLDARDFGFTVTEVRPPNGAVINQVNVAPQVFFSQAVNPSTVNTTRVRLDRVGSSLDPPGTVEIAPDNRSVTFVPNGALIPGISYRIQVSIALRDVHGNGFDADPFTPQRQSFNSTFRISGQAPVLRVRMIAPADGERDVPLNSRVVVGFTLAVDRTTVTDDSFFVTNPAQQKIPGTISFTSDNVTAIFIPAQNYATSTQHQVTITPDVRDEAGSQFDADPGGDPTPFFSRFTTAASADTTPPRVTAVDPANGAVAPPTTSVAVTFSEPIDTFSVTSNSFRLERGGNRVGGSISFNSAATVATLTPSSALATGQSFDVIVTTDVTDRSGNRLAQQFQSNFSTAATTAVINEVVTDPQRDWGDSSGGDGAPFNGTPGNGSVTDSDEWIEIYNAGNQTLNLRNWTLAMQDTTAVTHVIGSPPSTTFEVFSAGSSVSSFRPGAYLVIGNPAGEINNDIYLVLRDSGGALIDDVEIGDDPENDGDGDGAPDPGVDGNASSAGDEAVFRRPNGADTNNDIRDFDKGTASIGGPNRSIPLAGPSLPGIDGGLTGVAYGGAGPDEPGPFNHLYFVSSSNNESVLAVDLDDEAYQLSDFFNPRGVAFEASGSGSGFLYVLHASGSTGGSGVTRMRIEPSGPTGGPGVRVRVAAPESGASVALVSPHFNEPSGLTIDPESGLLYVANQNDSTVLEIDFDDVPRILRVFDTGLGPERLTAVEFGERAGRRGLFLADSGGTSLDEGPQGRLLFFALP
jgi:hypothetical protein